MFIIDDTCESEDTFQTTTVRVVVKRVTYEIQFKIFFPLCCFNSWFGKGIMVTQCHRGNTIKKASSFKYASPIVVKLWKLEDLFNILDPFIQEFSRGKCKKCRVQNMYFKL